MGKEPKSKRGTPKPTCSPLSASVRRPLSLSSPKSKSRKHCPLTACSSGLAFASAFERTAQILAEELGWMDVLMSASAEEFERVNEVGPRISQSILEFFDEEGNRAHREAPRCRAHIHGRKAQEDLSAGRPELRSYRLASQSHPRRRQDEDRIRRRPRLRFHQQEDPLDRCRRRCRLEARQGARARCGCVRRGRSAPITQYVAAIVSSCGLLPEPASTTSPSSATENSFLSSQLRAGMATVVVTSLSRTDAQTTQGLSRDSNQ